MTDTKANTTKPKESPKDALLSTTVAQLTGALTSLQEQLGDKKFEKRIRKAAKLLIDGVKFPTPASNTKKHPVAKKDTKPASAATAKTKKATIKVIGKKTAAK